MTVTAPTLHLADRPTGTDDRGEGTVPPGAGPPERWQPTRAGLVSLWRYAEETFELHRGRLLLRGPNGSGKSMALELLLPFLLDADTSPSRITSAAKSRGGLYERIMTGTTEPNRSGFAWVEFRRGSDCFTVGARLRASASTRRHDIDWFTTSQSVGHDLLLLDAQRVPLSRKALAEAIGDHGRIHASPEDHRNAVRVTLFPGFSADRYDSVITALLALRKEKLSQNLDLAKLSEVLSEALPPVDDHELAAVAEGFERLDRRRDELNRLRAEREEVRQLAARQRDYAQAVVAGLADAVRSAETERDRITRTERVARDELEAATTEAGAVITEQEGLTGRLDAVDVEIDALKSSDAYRDGASLADLRAEVDQVRRNAARDHKRVESRAADHREQQERLADASERERAATANLAGAEALLRESAVAVAAEGLVDEVRAAPDGDADSGDIPALVHAWVRSRRDLLAEVRAALAVHDDALRRRAFAEQGVADDETVVDARRKDRDAAHTAFGQAVERYAAAVDAWVASCQAVDPARLRAALPAPPDTPAAVAPAVAALARTLAAEHAVTRRDLTAARAAADEQRTALVAERDEVAAGGLADPPSPAWRSPRDVAGRPGAPLWQLVDLAPAADVDAGGPEGGGWVDRLEAALTAAGLLDAWVSPQGTLQLSDGHADVVLTVGASARPQSLGERLVPLEGAAVDADVTTRVLASIAVEATAVTASPDDRVVVGLDGTFRLGSAQGRGPDRPAVLLGAAARERRRLARLAELDAAIADADTLLTSVDRDLAALDQREAAVAADLAAEPGGADVDAAERAVHVADSRLADAEGRLVRSRRKLSDAEDAVRRALRALTSAGARHRLPTDHDGLAAVDSALGRFEQAVAAWARRRRDLAHAERARTRAEADEARAAGHAAEAAADHAATVRLLEEREGKLRALESSIGAEYEIVLGRISALDAERRTGRDRMRMLTDQRTALERRIGKLEVTVADAEAARARADLTRVEAHRRFVAAVTDGLVDDAGRARPENLDGVTAVLAAARQVAADLPVAAFDDQAVDRRSARVEERVHHVQGKLGGSADLARELSDDGWWVLRASVSGVRRRVAELEAALAAELTAGEEELAADEERLFEQTLAGSVRRALADRIRLANRLVDGINAQLAQVRTAAGGVEVRLRWEVDPDQPEAVRSARALLLRDPADLSEPERASLQDFVRARVDQARADLDAHAPWDARLRETLDYRAWHRFSLQLGHRDWDGFQPATSKRLQRLSTGERSIALHLPMLASIAAHYADDRGRPGACPRLILLDELFAGVDVANRAQLFGTFTAWDLDAVFTSDHEWCQYASLDGIAIHHLHPPSGDEPVTSTRFTWDGFERVIRPVAS